MRLGDTPKAQTDLAAGAKLESADVNQYYPVSKSLERVQGSGRLMLETYRVQARAEAYRRQESRNLARYEAQRKAEAEVLRATPPPPAPGDMAPAVPAEQAALPKEPAASPPADDGRSVCRRSGRRRPTTRRRCADEKRAPAERKRPIGGCRCERARGRNARRQFGATTPTDER